MFYCNNAEIVFHIPSESRQSTGSDLFAKLLRGFLVQNTYLKYQGHSIDGRIIDRIKGRIMPCAIDFQTESVLAINQKLKFLIHFQFFI